MNEPSPRTPGPRWFREAVVVLLALQVGLLWMQGSMLERQHSELQNLRQDVQDLSDSLDDFTGSFDQGATDDGFAQPSRLRLHRRRPLVRVLQAQDDAEKDARKDLEASRKSAQDAVAKARDVQGKLSLEENARKAEEKAKLEAAAHPYRPLLWIGAAVALLALVARAWMRRRG